MAFAPALAGEFHPAPRSAPPGGLALDIAGGLGIAHDG